MAQDSEDQQGRPDLQEQRRTHTCGDSGTIWRGRAICDFSKNTNSFIFIVSLAHAVLSHRKQQVWVSLHVLYVTELWNNKQEELMKLSIVCHVRVSAQLMQKAPTIKSFSASAKALEQLLWPDGGKTRVILPKLLAVEQAFFKHSGHRAEADVNSLLLCSSA